MVALAILITRRRWRAAGGRPGLVVDVAIWGVPAGIIGGRITGPAGQAIGRIGNYFSQELFGKPSATGGGPPR